MTSIYTNVLSNEELQYLNSLPEVLTAKASLDASTSRIVYFSVSVTDEICSTLQSQFGLTLSTGTSIPMRWIKGDTAPHVDVGASKFKNTYLLYLNDSPGEFVIDSQSYPIQANTGFVFNEGLSHTTRNTGDEPRLMIGPMSEQAFAVGGPYVGYYSTFADAFGNGIFPTPGTSIGDYTTFPLPSFFVVGDVTNGTNGGFTAWRIASTSTGSSNSSLVYANGSTLITDGSYFLYPSAPCFLEGSTILCQVEGKDEYIPVEELKKGTLVKTSLDGYKPVVLVGSGSIKNLGNDERNENRLYKCSPSKYPELKDDLYITGCHSILEFSLTEKQKEDTIKHLGKLFVTDKKYRLMACVDDRAEPWNSEGTYTIWHFALENEDETMNYGVYANGGLLVETCSINFMKNKSNMVIVKD